MKINLVNKNNFMSRKFPTLTKSTNFIFLQVCTNEQEIYTVLENIILNLYVDISDIFALLHFVNNMVDFFEILEVINKCREKIWR